MLINNGTFSFMRELDWHKTSIKVTNVQFHFTALYNHVLIQ